MARAVMYWSEATELGESTGLNGVQVGTASWAFVVSKTWVVPRSRRDEFVGSLAKSAVDRMVAQVWPPSVERRTRLAGSSGLEAYSRSGSAGSTRNFPVSK